MIHYIQCHTPQEKVSFVTYTSYSVFHSHLWQSLFRTQFKSEHIFMWTGPVMYVITFRVSTVSNMSWAISAKLWELFCIRPAYGVWIPQNNPQHTQEKTSQHLWIWLCTTWETRTHQTWDDYNWPTPPYGTAFFWLVFTQASKEKNMW